MGKIVAQRIRKRTFSWGSLTFLDSHRIVMDYGLYSVTFHRYYAKRNDYRMNWDPFRKNLLRLNNLTVARVFHLANRYEIQHLTKINYKGDGK